MNLERAFSTLRRRSPWVLLCIALAAGAAFGLSKQQTEEFTATAAVVFEPNTLSQQIVGLQPATAANAASQQATNVELLQLGDAAEHTATSLGHGLTAREVEASLAITSVEDSSVVDVAATSRSPQLAAAIANTYSKEFVAGAERDNRRQFSIALASVKRQLAELPASQRAGPTALALEDRKQSLTLLSKLRSGNVHVAEAASVPSTPSSPLVLRNTLVGGVLGLLVGLGVAFLLERLDRRIKDSKELEAIFGLPTLGAIPESDELSLSARPSAGTRHVLPPAEAEVFRMIRAHLRLLGEERSLRTLLVVSASQGDGKSTVSRHLAEAAASMGALTLLLEADLRAPTLGEQLAIPPAPGLSDVLSGEMPWTSVVSHVDAGPPVIEGHSEHRLSVILAGKTQPPNPAELMESSAMQRVLDQVRWVYDLVVIDTPPITAVSDAFPLLSKVDGIIIVGRIGSIHRRVADELHKTLVAVQAPTLGIIANGVEKQVLAPYAYGQREYGRSFG